MKPVITWILIADAQKGKVVSNLGPSKGLEKAPELNWFPDPAADYTEKPGVGHSIAGPASNQVSETNIKRVAQDQFAKKITGELEKRLELGLFDRLVVAAPPAMLGDLRKAVSPKLSDVIVAEVSKDLSNVPFEKLAPHFEGHLAL